MPKVKVQFKRKSGTITDHVVRIDDEKVTLGDDGTGEKEVASGDHALGCFVWGVPGAKFDIAILSPASAKWTPATKSMARNVKFVGKQFKV